MSSLSHVVSPETSEKPQLGDSAGDLSSRHDLDVIDEDHVNDAVPRIRGHTKNDKKDMRRLGKRQQLMRNFGGISAFSFTIILQATWEFLLIANTQGLIDGGLAGLFWSYLWTFFGFSIITLSLAEMASMSPTSGGQYHWVSEFAPPRYQKILSYVTGWMSTLSWQAGTAAGSFLTGTIIQGLLTVNNPNYVPTGWQGTLFVCSMVVVIYIFNIWGAKDLPLVQNVMLVVHTLSFLVVIIVLWVLAPKNSAKVVFTHFTNGGGWSTMGLSVMVGQISAIFGVTCSDATAHMSEEVADAGIHVPNAMFWSYMFNGSLGLVLHITYLFSITSVSDALADPSGYPFIYVFRSAVSTPGVNALTAIVLILVIISNVSFNASTSRQTFAFARDNGLPFSKWIARVHPTKQIPSNAILLTCGFTVLLALINIGSNVAFNAIISLQVGALLFTYLISISCVLWRRLHHPKSLPLARWSLGRWGVPVNVFSLLYLAFAFFWSFWPNSLPVDASSFNWSVVLFLAIGLLSLVMYAVQGRKVYDGPVVLVEGKGRI